MLASLFAYLARNLANPCAIRLAVTSKYRFRNVLTARNAGSMLRGLY